MRGDNLEILVDQVLNISENAIFLYQKDKSKVVYANPKAVELFGQDVLNLNEKKDKNAYYLSDVSLHSIKRGEEEIVLIYVDELKQAIHLKLNAVQWKNNEELVICTVLNTSEYLLEKKEQQREEELNYKERLKYLTEYDPLTNISNANRFYKDVGYLLFDEPEKEFAIISFDINKFKLINDIFGMSVGDDVLRYIAQTYQELLPDDALFCRRYSDVFFVCVSYKNRDELVELVRNMTKEMEDTRFSFEIQMTFGIYTIQDRMLPINIMCDRANLAKKTVKENVVSDFAFYDEQHRKEILETKEIEADMVIAIEENQFLLYLQPKYDLASEKIFGAEVLVRWNHPKKGLIMPNGFIPLFEKNGFIVKLDEYIWEETCKILNRWRSEGKKLLPLSVNVSRYHLKNNNLVNIWKRLIMKYNIPSEFLKLEITETFFYDTEDLYSVLQELQKMGFEVELDDFGSGYSSLNMIRQAPLNTIKIDREFLDQKLASEKGKTVINHAIALAKDLKLGVIAEGVETKEHVDFLKSSNCDFAQGYYFAKPMPVREFEKIYYK